MYAAGAGGSQIGAIVGSLGLLERGIVVGVDAGVGVGVSDGGEREPEREREGGGEERPLLGARGRRRRSREEIKGSIAGVYSLFGAVAILLLTKVGGKAFDRAVGAPFWMLAGFNGVLAVVAIGNRVWMGLRGS